jgi:hypothetical protein
MRVSAIVDGTAITLAILSLGACTGVVGLAHGDPGRAADSVGRAPTADAAAQAPGHDASATGAASAPARAAVSAAGGAVSAVAVNFSDHAQQLAAADPRLTPAAIASAIEEELRAHQLYAPAADHVQRTLAITVTDLTSTLASNATVLGYTFRNAVLIGEVRVQGEPGATPPPFTVHARTRVTNRGAGADAGSLGALFARFAVLTVADLRGVEAPAEAMPR